MKKDDNEGVDVVTNHDVYLNFLQINCPKQKINLSDDSIKCEENFQARA